jgi:hypothetical protein
MFCRQKEYLRSTDGRGAPLQQNNFSVFVNWLAAAHQFTQSTRIRAMCGHAANCKPDYLLRTENLGQDWLDMLMAEELPLIQLPHSNEGKATNNDVNRVAQGPLEFSTYVLGTINALESDMFTMWKYPRRDRPFVL